MNLKKGQTRVSDPSRSLTPIALQIPSDTYGDPYPNYLYLFYCYFFVPSEYDCNPIFPRVINYAILHIPPNSQNMEKKRKIMTTLFMCFFLQQSIYSVQASIICECGLCLSFLHYFLLESVIFLENVTSICHYGSRANRRLLSVVHYVNISTQ